MLDPNIDSLFDIPVSHTFVDDDSNSGFRYIIDDARLAMVDFMGHTNRC